MGKIQVKTKVGVILFDDPVDAAEFVTALQRGGGRKPRAVSRETAPGAHQLRKTFQLLKLVADAGPNGITSEKLSAELGLRGTRGLGSIASPARVQLKSFGFNLDELVTVVRGVDGNRWFGKPALRAVLDEIIKKVKEIQSEEEDGGPR